MTTLTDGLKSIVNYDADYFEQLGLKTTMIFTKGDNWVPETNADFLEQKVACFEVKLISEFCVENKLLSIAK